jgi:hypothetical protein
VKKCSSVAKNFLDLTVERDRRENAGKRKDSGNHIWPLHEQIEKRKKAAESAASYAPTPVNTPAAASSQARPRNTSTQKAKSTTSSNIFGSRSRSTGPDLQKVWSEVVRPKLEFLVVEELAHRLTPEGM